MSAPKRCARSSRFPRSRSPWRLPIGEEEDNHLGDFIEDRGAVAPAEAASYQLLKEQVEDVLDTLNLRERRVLQLRFGLEGRPQPHTGRSGQGVRRHPRAHPTDRGQGAQKAASPLPLKEAPGLPGVVRGDPVSPERDSSREVHCVGFRNP